MSKFTKRSGRSKPKISTASLPDIIFMLLFFFMVTTVLRDATLKLEVITPKATALTKLRKSLVSYIYVGVPKHPYIQELGDKPRIQLGDKFSEIEDIPLYLATTCEPIPERDRPKFNVSLRVDEAVTMGIVQDIKTELRKCGQLKINYSAKPDLE